MNSAEVRYLILGGYAVNYHGHHRTTGDLDLWIAVDTQNAARVSQVLQDFGFPAASVPPDAFLQVGKVFRFGSRPVRIELLTQPTGVEFESCYLRRVLAELDGVSVPIIHLADLKQNKRASGRTKDIADLENLP